MSLVVPALFGGDGGKTEYGTDVTSEFAVDNYSTSKISLNSVKVYRFGDLMSLAFSIKLKSGTHSVDEYDEILCTGAELDYYSRAQITCGRTSFYEFRFGGGITNVYALVFHKQWVLDNDYDDIIVTPPYFRYSVYNN